MTEKDFEEFAKVTTEFCEKAAAKIVIQESQIKKLHERCRQLEHSITQLKILTVLKRKTPFGTLYN